MEFCEISDFSIFTYNTARNLKFCTLSNSFYLTLDFMVQIGNCLSIL